VSLNLESLNSVLFVSGNCVNELLHAMNVVALKTDDQHFSARDTFCRV
jgi:hypothetical protein